MKLLNKTLKKYGLVPSEYRKIGGATIVGSNNGLFVAKEKKHRSNEDIYEYLSSRNFNYYPRIISAQNDPFEISEYIEEISMPTNILLDSYKHASLLMLLYHYNNYINNQYYLKYLHISFCNYRYLLLYNE